MTENYNKAAGPPRTPLSRSDDTAAAPVMPAAPGHQHQTNAADIAFPTRRLRLRTLSLLPITSRRVGVPSVARNHSTAREFVEVGDNVGIVSHSCMKLDGE